MLVAGGFCYRMLLDDGKSLVSRRIHRLLRVPPTGSSASGDRLAPAVEAGAQLTAKANYPCGGVCESSPAISAPSFRSGKASEAATLAPISPTITTSDTAGCTR
jgi:hypothetical protein